MFEFVVLGICMKFTPRAFLQRGVIKRSILLNIAQLSKNEVMETKAKLSAKAIDRRELENDEEYELKESQNPLQRCF